MARSCRGRGSICCYCFLAAYERALALNPNHADILADWGGRILPSVLGRAEEGIEVVKKAMRLNPFHADWYVRGLATAYFVARRFEEAISMLKSVEYHTFESRLILVASYAHADRLEEGRIDAANVLRLKPDFSTASPALYWGGRSRSASLLG